MAIETITNVSVHTVASYSGSEQYQAKGFNSNGAQVLTGLTHYSRASAEADAAAMLGKKVY